MIYYAISAVVIIIDRISKILAVKYLMQIQTYPLLEGIFHLTYAQNTGASFSIFKEHTQLLAIVSAIASIGLVCFLFRQIRNYPKKNAYLLSIAMILGGAVGNLIDRAYFGYVVDFLDFRLINFAIFNLADSFICVGAIIFVSYLLFDKELFKGESNGVE